MVTYVGDSVAVRLVHSEHISGVDVVVEEVPDNLLVVADAILSRAVFRRPALRDDKASIG
jgi:hypothetical protein